MTSRLKRKLDDVQPSSNMNESFCQIGTPLPPLVNTKKDDGEFVPLWKQEVKDDQGRRRLHGAFTGGFSAGYYNSVGSKEGWTPSTFVSSRTHRAQTAQKPEDFMDEEDLAAMKEEQKLETKEGFGVEGRKGKGRAGTDESNLPDFLSDLVTPSTSGIGSKLLTKLGWRPGQGVGPRITARALKLQDSKASLYDRVIPRKKDKTTDGDEAEDEAEGGDDDEAKKHLFAPRDTPLRVYPPKDGSEGLGWVRGAGLERGQGAKESEGGEAGGSGGVNSTGFGYGIEDADEDDADVYGTSSTAASISSGPGRFAFHQEDDADVLKMGSSSSRRAPLKPTTANATASTSTWHDGRPVIRGFTVASDPVKVDRWFAPPEVPQGWEPRPSRIWNRGKKWDLASSTTTADLKGKGREVIDGDEAWRRRQAMSSDQRGALLGEKKPQLESEPPSVVVASSEPPVKASAKSVFDFMSAKDRERIASLTAPKTSTSTTSAPTPNAPPPPPPPPTFVVPTVDAPTANGALHGFMPFGDNPARQARYRAYLTSQATHTDPTSILSTILPGQTQSSLLRELTDFQAAAQIFRPMSASMSNRFTSATTAAAGGDTQTTKAGLFVLDPKERAERIAAKEKEAEEERLEKLKPRIPENETPMQQAARMGMYGPLTRTVKDFFPVKLLCKRFGVQDPHPEGPTSADDVGAFAQANSSSLKPVVDPNAWQSKFVHVVPLSAASSEKEEVVETAATTVVDDEEGGKEGAAPTERPSMDIFKAIFASDDESSDDDEEEDEEDSTMLGASARPPSFSLSSAPISRPPPPSNLPPPPPPPSALSSSLDPTSFRPTFLSKSARDEDDSPSATSTSTSSKPKKDKDRSKKSKKSKKALISFQEGDEEDEEKEDAGEKEERSRKREAERKRRREDGEEKEKERKKVKSLEKEKEKEMVVDEEEDVWVEKKVVVASTMAPAAAHGGRKTASDFL